MPEVAKGKGVQLSIANEVFFQCQEFAIFV
jgi:hypothetical protein